MLTKTDLNQIGNVIEKRLEPIKKDLTCLKKDATDLKKDVKYLKKKVNRIDKTVSLTVENYDEGIEQHLALPP